MEVYNSGLRARNREYSKGVLEDGDSKCKDETFTVKLWAFLGNLLSMKHRKGTQISIIVCLSKILEYIDSSKVVKLSLDFRHHQYTIMVLPQ